MQTNITWRPEDAVATRDYFNSEVGQKLLQILQQTVRLEEGKTFEEEALNYRLVKGAHSVIAIILKACEDVEIQTDETPYVNPANG